MSFFKDILTDEYGKNYDLVPIMAGIGYLVGITLYIASCFTNRIHFSYLEYAGGYAATLASVTGALRLKPPAVPPTNFPPATP